MTRPSSTPSPPTTRTSAPPAIVRAPITIEKVVPWRPTIAGGALVLVVGGLGVLDGRVTLGTLLLVLAYLGFVYGPLSAIAHTTGELQQAFASARRVRAALALAPEPSDPPDALDPAGLTGEVRFDRVSFAYEPDRPVLHEVSFVARPGQLVAIVGPSGGGKSTLVSLIAVSYTHLTLPTILLV